MKRVFGTLLIALTVAFAASAALADDDTVVPGPLGMVKKLEGKHGTGAGSGLDFSLNGSDAPVVSETTAQALALLRLHDLDAKDGTAPLTSEQQLAAIDDLLRKLGASDPDTTAGQIYTIEQASDATLKKVIQAARDPEAPEWLKPLAKLARMEAAARGLDVKQILDEPLGEPAPEPGAAGDNPGRPAGSVHGAPMGDDLGATSAPFDGASESDLEVLARIVKGEIPENAPREGQVAIAAIVLNRVRAGGFGSSIPAVAHAPLQFSCYNPDQRARLYWGPIPQYAWDAARAALGGENPVPGCTHYFNPYLVSPRWADSMTLYRRIGTSVTTTHDFYRP